MLHNKKLKAFIPTIDREKAKAFYIDLLGLELLSEDGHGLEVNANGTALRISMVQSLTPHPFTVLGWGVEDISATLQSLRSKGVVFEKYDFFKQDSDGVWEAPGGTKVAWFKDPDGNLLSLSQH